LSNRIDSWVRLAVSAALILGAGVFLRSRSQAEILPPRHELASFPLILGGWTGSEVGISADVREVLGDGDFLQRIYQLPDRESYVTLFIAYFPSQRMGSTMHSPQNCLPGSGWTPISRTPLRLSGPSGRQFVVNRYVISKGAEQQLVLYWYQAHGRVVASEYWAKFYLVADAIRMNRSDGSLVRIMTPLKPGEAIASAEQRAVEFSLQVSANIKDYVPN
jgi:EpsI family protein